MYGCHKTHTENPATHLYSMTSQEAYVSISNLEPNIYLSKGGEGCSCLLIVATLIYMTFTSHFLSYTDIYWTPLTNSRGEGKACLKEENLQWTVFIKDLFEH